MKFLLVLLLLAGSVSAVSAGEDFYEYGMKILSHPPIWITGPGSTTWKVQVPVYAHVGQVYLKNCTLWGIDDATVFDQDIALYQSGASYSQGGYTFTVGDRKEGRTQPYCLRLPYFPLEEPHE